MKTSCTGVFLHERGLNNIPILIINAGSSDGVTPGNVFSVYRIMYPSVPTPRNVVGEATVVAAQDTTATAKITYSREEIMVGDQVELR